VFAEAALPLAGVYICNHGAMTDLAPLIAAVGEDEAVAAAKRRGEHWLLVRGLKAGVDLRSYVGVAQRASHPNYRRIP
jgi:hypothetical protein